MGAVLVEEHDSCQRINCYFPKVLSESQTNSATRCGSLWFVTFMRHFRHYFVKRLFTVVTDYRALPWLHSFEGPDGITTRWLKKLAPFDYAVKHRPGKLIGHADGLFNIPPAMNTVAEFFPESDPQFCSGVHAPRNSLDVSHDTDHRHVTWRTKKPRSSFCSCKKFSIGRSKLKLARSGRKHLWLQRFNSPLC